MTVLERILQLKNERGWTEYKLSEQSGISQTTISSWFRKDITPSVPSLEKICMAFNISMSQFFAYGNEPLALTEEQRQLLDCWSRLSAEQRRLLLELADTL